jgi:hypothetical protein
MLERVRGMTAYQKPNPGIIRHSSVPFACDRYQIRSSAEDLKNQREGHQIHKSGRERICWQNPPGCNGKGFWEANIGIRDSELQSVWRNRRLQQSNCHNNHATIFFLNMEIQTLRYNQGVGSKRKSGKGRMQGQTEDYVGGESHINRLSRCLLRLSGYTRLLVAD